MGIVKESKALLFKLDDNAIKIRDILMRVCKDKEQYPDSCKVQSELEEIYRQIAIERDDLLDLQREISERLTTLVQWHRYGFSKYE